MHQRGRAACQPHLRRRAQRPEAASKYIAVRTALKDLITEELSGTPTEKEIEAKRRRLNRDL